MASLLQMREKVLAAKAIDRGLKQKRNKQRRLRCTMRVLFICNVNQNRSKTAEEIFKERFETRSAGLYNNLVTEQDLEWAEVVVVMSDEQRREIGKRFPKQYLKRRIVNFNIGDIYRYQQPELIRLLKERADALLQPFVELR
jgi:predicted protein tyrosine phosphatase